MKAPWPFLKKRDDGADAGQLTSDRLFLRPALSADHAQWAKVRKKNYAFLKPFEPAWPSNCLERDFFERRVLKLGEDRREDRAYSYLIFTGNAALIGGINLNNVTRGAAQFASLGYWLDENAQGNGYMGEAARLVLHDAFDPLRLLRVNAATLLHNERSIRMLERLGFEREGQAKSYLQIDGRRQDHILFGLNAVDFQKNV